MNYYDFTETVYEIAFGNDAINKGYSDEDILNKLLEYSNKALSHESCQHKPECTNYNDLSLKEVCICDDLELIEALK